MADTITQTSTDSSSPTSEDPRIEAANLERALADARKASAEAHKAAVDARKADIDSLTPTVPTELPADKLDVPEGLSVLGSLAAYRALEKPARSIAQAAVDHHVDRLWIVPDDRYRHARDAHTLVQGELDRFSKGAAAAKRVLGMEGPEGGGEETFAGPIVAAAGLRFALSAAPALMSLFQTNRTVRTGSVAMSFNAAAAAVARALNADRDRMAVTVAGVSAPSDAELDERVAQLESDRDALSWELARQRADAAVPDPELATQNARMAGYKALLDAAGKANGTPDLDKLDSIVKKIGSAAGEAAKKELESAKVKGGLDRVGDLVQVIDQFLVQLRTPDATGATPLSLAAARRAAAGGHILVLEISFAGCDSIYEDVRFKRDRGLHIGSVALDWFLLDASNQVVDSGIATAQQSAATKIGDPRVVWEAA